MMRRMIVVLLVLSMVMILSACKRGKKENGDVALQNDISGYSSGLEKVDEKNEIVSQVSEKIITRFNPQTGVLTVCGSGQVNQIYCPSHKPTSYSLVKKIVIEEGITKITNSFVEMDSLESVEFPSSLESIGYSFQQANGLKELTIHSNIQSIFDSFNYCGIQKLQLEGTVYLYGSFNSIEIKQAIIPEESTCSGSFRDCKNLKEVVLEKNVKIREINDGNHGYADPFDEVWATILYNFQNGEDKPKIYRYLPNDGEELLCGDESKYLPILIPEGESWKDYRDVPMTLKSAS